MTNRQDSTEQRRRKHMAHMDDKRMTDNTRSAVDHSKDAARLARTALGVHDRAREVVAAMTDNTAPEHVKAWADSLMKMSDDISGDEAIYTANMLRALSARVAELEAIGRAKDYDYGRAIAERDAVLKARKHEGEAFERWATLILEKARAAMQEGGER